MYIFQVHCRTILLLAVVLSFLSVSAQSTVTYLPSTEDFPNPERGFYFPTNSNNGLLDQGGIAGLRNEYTPWQANYQVHSTLVFRYFMLTDFVNGPISTSFLDDMQTDFTTIRNAGAKLIIRFSYINTGDGDPPPYGDATKAQVLSHIQQLAPILQANSDVIAAVQLGFIGVYGEGYYTDHFGFPALPEDGGTGYLTAQNWDDRNEIIAALLAALPDNRMIQVRYPQQKQKFVYGNTAPTTSAPSGGRIGFHNDCFLASDTDVGTFVNYDQNSPAHANQITDLRSYMATDSETVVVGGETCDTNSVVIGDELCAAEGGRADTDLELFHYSFLNSDYNNPAVNNKWTGVCLDEIKRRLGYRFELQSGTFPNEAQPGQTIVLNLSIRNDGYAAPYNPRGIEYVLRHTTTADLYYAVPAADPQQWAASTTTNIDETFCLPNDLPTGDYELLLHLPDPEPSLYGNPDYAIRLANRLPDMSDVWESSTGFNRLGHTLTVNNTAMGVDCSGETTFSSASPLPVTWLQFVAKAQNQQTVLNWQVQEEENNQGFAIERSTDGRGFTPIGWIPYQPANNGNYQYTDRGPLTKATYFYRLQQTDWDGRTSYSDIREVRFSPRSATLSVFPNPNHGIFHIEAKELGKAVIEIFDSRGKKWLESTHDFRDGALFLPTVLPAGVYLLRCRDSGHFFTEKVIIE